MHSKDESGKIIILAQCLKAVIDEGFVNPDGLTCSSAK